MTRKYDISPYPLQNRHGTHCEYPHKKCTKYFSTNTVYRIYNRKGVYIKGYFLCNLHVIALIKAYGTDEQKRSYGIEV